MTREEAEAIEQLIERIEKSDGPNFALELLKRWVSEFEPMFAKNINGEIVGVVALGTTDVLIYARALPGYYQKAAEPRRFRFKRTEQPQ